MPERLGAVVLAGGRAARLGGADKPGIVIGDQSLLTLVVRAASDAGAGHLVVVGPARPGLSDFADSVEFTCERPPQAGPVAALDAGLRLVRESWVFLLAADLPFLRASHLGEVATVADRTGGGAVLVDDEGRPQWLTSCWPARTLRTALSGYAGSSLGGLLGPLSPTLVTLEHDTPPPWLDCDTPEDLAAARRLARLQEGTL